MSSETEAVLGPFVGLDGVPFWVLIDNQISLEMEGIHWRRLSVVLAGLCGLVDVVDGWFRLVELVCLLCWVWWFGVSFRTGSVCL